MAQTLNVNGQEITVIQIREEDYINITDMLKTQGGEFFFHNWHRNRNTVEFLGVWEKVYNPNFNFIEFDRIKSLAGVNSFRLIRS